MKTEETETKKGCFASPLANIPKYNTPHLVCQCFFRCSLKKTKAPVKHILSRGYFVETAGIEPASEKRTTESPTGFFAR